MEPSCTVSNKQTFRLLFSKKLTGLAMLVVSFFVLRFGLLVFGYSHIAHPGFDEPVSGVLTCDILDGQLRAPLFSYQYENRSGDTLIEGLLLVPFFKMFGRSIFSTKLLALFSSTICLLIWILLIKRYYGIKASLIFASLFAFSPPMFARLNVTGTVDSHHLINPIIAVQILLLFRIIENSNKPSAWLWLGLGFCAGLGAYTFYTYLIFIAFCILFIFAFKSSVFTVTRLGIFLSGFGVGFAPRILRYLYSYGGGGYLASTIRNIGIDPWRFIQNLVFNLPHSFGYNYPFRSIGFIAVLFYLLIIFFAGVIFKKSLTAIFRQGFSLKISISKLTPSMLLGVFCMLFPLFFVICLSLSPLNIGPFEYWPSIGLFSGFSSADLLRYRWLYMLFPFYFAVCALGMSTLFSESAIKSFYKIFSLIVLGFFLLCGIKGTVTLYSKKDFGKIFYYKGYNYDLFAPRFFIGNFSPLNIQKALSILHNFPEENKAAAYQCFATLIAKTLINDSNRSAELREILGQVPNQYMNDFIYGIVRLAQDIYAKNITEEDYQPIADIVGVQYPQFFYENWGFRHLGYKYYELLINQELLFNNIPRVEQWFYKDFLNRFKQEIADNNSGKYYDLFDEIKNAPQRYQNEVVRGIGKLVGAEMLFDSLNEPDYPLDGMFGEQFPALQRESFYEGVGCGFAETLCRFWRMLLLPKDTKGPRYKLLLDIEWNRCLHLMGRLSSKDLPEIKKGFQKELNSRHLSAGIKNYINGKFTSSGI